MRAIVCRELGPPEILCIEEREPLTPGDGQVVVDVRAAGVNYVDALFVGGQYQIKPPLPFVPGGEIAGVVSGRGAGVEGFALGDRVLAMCGLGGFAEQVVLDPTQLVAVPGALDFARAAAFTQSYCTALFALRERAHVRAGESLLVLGAGGGVGLATIDVACALGARVIGAASSDAKRAAARAAGAAAVIDTTREDLKGRVREFAGGSGIDVVLDPVGGALAEPALRALGYLGRYLVIGFAAGVIPRLPLNQVLLRNRAIVGVDWGAWAMQHPAEQRALLTELLRMVSDGRLSPAAPTAYPFERVAAALNDLLNRRVTGKIVLVP
jgi:NADPH2:quinone reductase